MRFRSQWTVAACAIISMTSCARAENPTSGIPVGDPIGSYAATKCGGIDDGVEAGKALCYT